MFGLPLTPLVFLNSSKRNMIVTFYCEQWKSNKNSLELFYQWQPGGTSFLMASTDLSERYSCKRTKQTVKKKHKQNKEMYQSPWLSALNPKQHSWTCDITSSCRQPCFQNTNETLPIQITYSWDLLYPTTSHSWPQQKVGLCDLISL